MAKDAGKRNQRVYGLLNDLLKEGRISSGGLGKLDKEVESLFATSILGHREIVLTIVMARLINPSYKASENFYACNPRSLFENPIRKFLQKHGVPHKKSGPLNVAKNIAKINEDWATNKRGDAVAMNVVKIVGSIEKMKQLELEKFASAYIFRYAKEASRVKKMSYKPAADSDPVNLSNLCQSLISDVPDAGATPQAVVGLLIEAAIKDMESTSKVFGHLDSVSTTNTTSKKAGDIVETLSSGVFIYEVTVKKFDENRLRDSYESLRADPTMKEVEEVFVICRPIDIYPKAKPLGSGVILATQIFQDVAYYFVDIFELIRVKLLFMTPTGRILFYSSLTNYVNHVNTSEKVKTYFRKWHEDRKGG